MGVLQADGNQKGLRFDGTNDNISLPFTSLPSGNVVMTFSVEVDIVRTNDQIHSSYGDSNTGANVSIFSGGNKFGATYGFSEFSTNNTFPLGRYVVTLVKFAGLTNNFKIFVNGVNQAFTLTFGSTVTTSVVQTRFRLGIYTNDVSAPLLGNISKFKIWDRSLTDLEVLQDYIEDNVTTNLVRNYQFRDTSGFILTDLQSGHNGTLNNYTTGDVTVGSTNKWLYNCSSEPFDNKRRNGVLLINNN